MSDELRQKIEETAGGPKRVRTDAGEVESQDVGDMIEADKHLAGKRAMADPSRAVRRVCYIPPGGND
jgi:hypothetical protein